MELYQTAKGPTWSGWWWDPREGNHRNPPTIKKGGGDDSFFFFVGKMLGYGTFFLGSSLHSFDCLARKSGPGHVS